MPRREATALKRPLEGSRPEPETRAGRLRTPQICGLTGAARQLDLGHDRQAGDVSPAPSSWRSRRTSEGVHLVPLDAGERATNVKPPWACACWACLQHVSPASTPMSPIASRVRFPPEPRAAPLSRSALSQCANFDHSAGPASDSASALALRPNRQCRSQGEAKAAPKREDARISSGAVVSGPPSPGLDGSFAARRMRGQASQQLLTGRAWGRRWTRRNSAEDGLDSVMQPVVLVEGGGAVE